MTTALQEFVQDTASQTADHYREYLAVAKEFALGEKPETYRVNAALADANKTTDELQQDVDAIAQRMEWKAAVDRKGEAESERRKIDAKVAKLDEKLEKAEREHDAAVYPLTGQIEDLAREIQAATEAKGRLINSVLEPEWHTRRNTCRNKLTVVEADLHEVRSTIEAARPKITQPESAHLTGEDHAEEIARVTNRLEGYELRRDELQIERESLLAEMRELEAEALNPA